MKIIKIEIFRFQMFHVCSHLANGLAQRFSFLCPNGECEKLYIDSVLTESVFGKQYVLYHFFSGLRRVVE